MTPTPKVKADHNIFLSWSGKRSRWIAECFREWLPLTLQASKPWMSTKDIDKGTRSLQEIAKALEGVKFGISFLTPENLNEPWILYEAGALTRNVGNVDDKHRLYTFLLGGLQNQDVKQPLGILQHTSPTEEDTLTLLKSINSAVSESPLSDKQVEQVFGPFWRELEKKLTSMPAPEEVVDAKRSLPDMVTEILEILRSEKDAPPYFPADLSSGYVFGPVSSGLVSPDTGLVITGSSIIPSATKKTFFVKLKGTDKIQMVEGNYASEEPTGTLIIFNSSGAILHRIDKNVELWGQTS